MIIWGDSKKKRRCAFVTMTCVVWLTASCSPDAANTSEDGNKDETIVEVAEPIKWDGNGHDYLFILAPATWDQARATCLINGYYLVSINTAAEEAWLHAQENTKGGSAWWIGYSDTGFEGLWVWEDQSSSTYTNWNPGEPNNQGDEDCVTDNVNVIAGKWDDWTCSSAAKFICERNY